MNLERQPSFASSPNPVVSHLSFLIIPQAREDKDFVSTPKPSPVHQVDFPVTPNNVGKSTATKLESTYILSMQSLCFSISPSPI